MKKNLLMMLLFVFLAACSGNTPVATLTPTAWQLATPTASPTPSPTPALAPSKGLANLPAGFFPITQIYLSQAEILAMDPSVASLFETFQNEIKTTKPDATFSAWGALARTSTGQQYYTPFFEVSEGETLAEEYVVRAKSDGSALVTLRLQQAVVIASDGQEYYTLSQVNNSDTLEAIPPIPLIYIGIPKAQFDAMTPEEQTMVVVYFNAFGGILPENSPQTVSVGSITGDRALKVRAALKPIETFTLPPETLYYQDAFVLQPESSPEIEGVRVDFKLIVNQSLVDRLFSPIQRLVPNETYINAEGKQWDEAIADYILDYTYQAWKGQNNSNISQTEWYKMVAAYQTGSEYNGSIPTFDDVAIEVRVDDFLSNTPNRNKVVLVAPGNLEIVFCNNSMSHLRQTDSRGLSGFGFAARNNGLRIFVGVNVDTRFGLVMTDMALRGIEIAFFPERFSRHSSINYTPEGEEKVLYRNSSGKGMIPFEPFPTDWTP